MEPEELREEISDEQQDDVQPDEEPLDELDEGEEPEPETEPETEPDATPDPPQNDMAWFDGLPPDKQDKILAMAKAQQELEELRRQQQAQAPPQSVADLNDQQFAAYLDQEYQRFSEEYLRLLGENQFDAATKLQWDHGEWRSEVKQHRQRTMAHRHENAIYGRARQVAQVVDSDQRYQGVRWCRDAAIDEALKAGVDPAWFVRQLAMYDRENRQRGQQQQDTRTHRRRAAYTETVDGGAPPGPKSSNEPDFRTMWRDLM